MNYRNEQRIPLRLIAETARVSRMTVSLALRNHPSLPESTRGRIRQIAQQLGYRPDPEISHLMERIREKRLKHATGSLAYVTSSSTRSAWKGDPSQCLYYEGASQQAEMFGYNLEEFILGGRNMTGRALSNILYNRGIEGVIVAPISGATAMFAGFRWEQFAAVEIGYSLKEPALHRSCNHQFQSMLLLMRKLFEAGYSRIGLAVDSVQDSRVNNSWSAAHYVGGNLWGNGRDVPPLLNQGWGEASFEHWMEKHRPQAIIAASEEVATWLQNLGLRVPEDVGLAMLNLTPGMTGMAGINQNSESVGAAAVDLLVASMRQEQRGAPALPRVVMIEGTYVAGTTIAGEDTGAPVSAWANAGHFGDAFGSESEARRESRCHVA